MPAKLIVTRPPDFVEFRKDSINQGIHQRFEEQVRFFPGKIALKTQEVSHTYGQANGFANSIAEEILLTAGTELTQAGILLANDPEMIISILACLKAHKAYVPLDPNFPAERLRAMLEDAELSVLLTDDQNMKLAEELAGKSVRIINTSQLKRHADAPNPRVHCNPLDRAYILFTSGSTGRPKGIEFLHRNLLHTTMCLTNQLFFSPSDRVTWLHSASFSASVVDIYCCLTNGGTLYPWDAKSRGFIGLMDWLVQEKVTTFQWIPSAFRQFLRTVPENFVFNDIRIVVMASESLTIREVELFRRYFAAGHHIVNQVGTSESYNYRLYPVDHHIAIESVNVAGGYPVSEDRQVVILDEERREMPLGNVGEIGVKSPFMSGGYWRDQALTDSKFIRIGADETPVYLTGDLGKIETDGCLIHLGRKDFQVKIRGYRVELAEIDQMLTAAPGIADSAAWVVKNRVGEDQLVGFVVLKDPATFNQQEVQKYLESRLPEYMVPRHYVVLQTLPTLPTGKVNRKGLPNPFELAAPQSTPAPLPLASVETEVIKLFKELLQIDEVSPDSSFLKAGGDSLLTAVLLHRIHQRFGVEILLNDFSESSTPTHLAALIKAALSGENASSAAGKPEHAISEYPAAATRSKSRIADQAKFPTQTENASKTSTSRISYRKNLVIIGAGMFAREIYTWAEHAIAAGAGWKIKGFLDKRPDALKGYDYECKVLGDVENYEIEKNDVFVGAIGDPNLKLRCYASIVSKGGRFVNVIHPRANIGKNVELGEGIVLAPFASVTSDIIIGNHVTVGAFSNVGHDAVIGDWCQISSHCGINGAAKLEEGAFLGSHACIIPGIRVGAWAFVGAGSVVIKDVPPGTKVFGNPAAPIGRIKTSRGIESA